jgi:thioesterase domain-containing protein
MRIREHEKAIEEATAAVVSFEIAQQLVRAGERVSFLGLVDTTFHDAHFRWPGVSEALRLSRKFRRVQGLRDLVRRTLRFITRTLRFIKRGAMLRQYDLPVRLGYSLPYEQRVTHYIWLCLRANRRYVPKSYLGHITMFSSAGNSEQQRAHWGPLAHGGLTVLEMPADHFDMAMPPHNKLLAEHFDACLDAAARRE